MNDKPEQKLKERPRIAIIDPNTLAILGLKQILQNVLPIMQVDTFNSFAELERANPEMYFHYFVATSVVLENRSFFLDRKNKAIVLTASTEPHALQMKVLSDREIEVLSLIVQGLINKEIADRLNIGLTTVITHRKNIMDKLGMKSVSALTIYAVMHGYVDISKI